MWEVSTAATRRMVMFVCIAVVMVLSVFALLPKPALAASSEAAIIQVFGMPFTSAGGTGTHFDPIRGNSLNIYCDMQFIDGRIHLQMSPGATGRICNYYNSTFEPNSYNQEILRLGDNCVYIEVTAADNTTKRYYEVTLKRAQPAFLDSVAGIDLQTRVSAVKGGPNVQGEMLFEASIAVPAGKATIVDADLGVDDCVLIGNSPNGYGAYGMYSDPYFQNKVSSITLNGINAKTHIYVMVGAGAYLIDEVYYDVTVTRQGAGANPVAGITLSTGNTITDSTPGGVLSNTATVLPTNATNKMVTWSSSHTQVAIVNENGLVTPLRNGKTVIRATAQDGTGVFAEKTVTVKRHEPVAKITITGATAITTHGQTAQLAAGIAPIGAPIRGVTWISSNTAVATVSSTGLVTPKTNGTVKILALSDDSVASKYASVDVVISGQEPSAMAAPTIKAGAKQMTVTWKKLPAVQKITKYQVQYRVKGTTTWKTVNVAASKSSVAIKKLQTGKTYQVRICAINGAGVGKWSAAKTSKKIK
jgi:uncharacterized protein YjdB